MPFVQDGHSYRQTYLDKMNNSEGPFGGKVKIRLIKKEDTDKDLKLGTYGI